LQGLWQGSSFEGRHFGSQCLPALAHVEAMVGITNGGIEFRQLLHIVDQAACDGIYQFGRINLQAAPPTIF
jgi:hypothetical protein